MTGRIIILTAAILVGAMIGLVSFSVVQPAGVNPDMPVFERSDLPPSDLSTTKLLPRMSDERRRQRALQLVGKPMNHVFSGRLINPLALKKRGSKVLEEMMDECFLLTDETLLAMHLKKVLAEKVDWSQVGYPKDRVLESQLRSCQNVVKVYDETHMPPS